MELLKEWNDFENQEQKARKAFRDWWFRNLEYDCGTEYGSIDDIFGFAYTSSSAFAALWVCNSQWHYKYIPDFAFRGIAISTDSFAVAVFESKTNDVYNPTLLIPFGNVSYIPKEVKE